MMCYLPDRLKCYSKFWWNALMLALVLHFRLVYCLVGKCDPQDDHLEVSTTTDDYLWLKLSQLTIEADYDAAEQLTLPKFQHLLLNDFGLNFLVIESYNRYKLCTSDNRWNSFWSQSEAPALLQDSHDEWPIWICCRVLVQVWSPQKYCCPRGSGPLWITSPPPSRESSCPTLFVLLTFCQGTWICHQYFQLQYQ